MHCAAISNTTSILINKFFETDFTKNINVKRQRRFDRSTVILKMKSNDRRSVETSLLFNVNIFSEIRFKKLVDSTV